jgi:single-stranded DNA-binding protein
MINALIAGRLYGRPQERSGKNGQAFATAKVRVPTRDGNAIFVNVIAFEDAAVTAILALDNGDSIALTGELTPKVYMPPAGEPRPALDLLAHAVVSAYHVARKRKAVTERDRTSRRSTIRCRSRGRRALF